jgi:hypothetical protein
MPQLPANEGHRTNLLVLWVWEARSAPLRVGHKSNYLRVEGAFMKDTRIMLATLKGVIEHNDAGAYFGSLYSLPMFVDQCIEEGWLSQDEKATEKGRAAYVQYKLDKFSQTAGHRWYFWDWGDLK